MDRSHYSILVMLFCAFCLLTIGKSFVLCLQPSVLFVAEKSSGRVRVTSCGAAKVWKGNPGRRIVCEFHSVL